METKQQLDLLWRNIQSISLSLSEKTKKEVENISTGEFDADRLILSLERVLKTLAIITELAPFFETKLQIEGAEGLRDWLLEQHECIGDERQRFLALIETYQKALIENTGHVYLTGQGTLL